MDYRLIMDKSFAIMSQTDFLESASICVAGKGMCLYFPGR